MKKILLGGLALFASLGCAVPPESATDSVDRQSIVGGTDDTADPAIIMIFVQNTTQEAACTATVVSPHVLLTAAHCLDPAIVDTTVAEPHTYYVFIGDDINNAAQANDAKNFVMVEKTIVDPLFTFDPSFATPPSHDIGAVITATALTAPPIPMNRAPLGPEWVGQPARIVGYGLSLTSDPNSSEKKHEATTKIAGLDDEFEWQTGSIPHTCEGDSGGPTLITRNGIESVAGVHSWIEHAKSCTGKGVDMRADVDAVPFIDALIAQYDPGFVVPGDGSSAEGGAGGGDNGGGGNGGAASVTGASTAAGGSTHENPSDSSGCSVAAPSSSSVGVSLFMLAALGLARSKRRCSVARAR